MTADGRRSAGWWLGWGLKIGLTLLATYFLFRSLRLSWAQLADLDLSRWRPRPGPFVASVVLLLAVFVYLVALWARLIRVLGGPILGLGDAVAVFFTANLGRYIPGKFWQLAGLVYLAGKRGVSVTVASSAAVLAQIFSLGAAVAVAALYFAAGGGTARVPAGLLPGALAVVALVWILISVPPVLRALLRWGYRLGGEAGKVPPMDAAFGIRWLLLHLPAWLGYGMAFRLLWSSFPALPAAGWTIAVGAFAAAYVLGYAAIFAPAGIGVREGVMALLLAPWLGAAEGAALAVAARVWMTVGELLPLVGVVGVGGWNWARGRPKEGDHAR